MMDNYTPSENTEFNGLYHERYNQQSSMVSTLFGGAVATVADFGTSVWNSLPGTDYVGTEEVLANISDDALRVYEENPDVIHAASFITGMFLPTGLALKGMQMARAGVKGANWFSSAGKVQSQAKIEKMFADGLGATSEYRAAKMAFYGRGFANNLADAAAMEFALVGAMHAHPLMETYMAEPVKHFGIGLAFGGVIGGGIGHAVDRFALGRLEKNITGNIESTINKDLTSMRAAEPAANQIIAHQANVQTLEKMLATHVAKPDTVFDDLMTQTVTKALSNAKVRQGEVFDNMIMPEVAASIKANPAMKEQLMALLSKEEFAGANEIGFLTQKLDGPGSALTSRDKTTGLLGNLVFGTKKTKYVDPTTGLETETKSLIDVAYSPELDKFISMKQIKHYGRARDTGLSPEELAKSVGDFRLPNTNIAEEVFSKNAAAIDAHYIGTLAKVDAMSVDQVKAIMLSTDDLPLRNAILARIAREPNEFTGHAWKVTDNKPNFETFNQQIIKSAGDAGVKPTHLDDILAQTTPALYEKNYNLLKLLPRGTKEWTAMDRWLRGDKEPLIKAMNASRQHGSDPELAKVFDNIYDSAASKALREMFRTHADDKGYVYLYRGISKGKAVGHGPIASYTTDPVKAAEFMYGKSGGSVKLYKVLVDDIVGGINDMPGAKGGIGGVWKNEVIVRAGTLESHASPATLPIRGPGEATLVSNTTHSTVKEVDALALSQELVDGKDAVISSMLRMGLPMETIAIRTNTPVGTVRAFSAMTEGSSIADLLTNNLAHTEYNSASRIAEYMDPSKKMLRVKGDINKQTFSQKLAGLDAKNKADMSHEMTAAFLAQSSSVATREIGSYFFSEARRPLLGLIRAKLAEFSNGGAGNKFITSTDFFARNMGELGMVATTMGKDMVKMTNKAIDNILEPLNHSYSKIKMDPVALTEYNTAVNINAGIKGFREFKDGQFWTRVKATGADGKPTTILEPVMYNGKEFKVVSESVLEAMAHHQTAGRDLYAMKNSINRILGKGDMADIGFWLPAFNPRDKFIAYVHNAGDDTTKLLWGNTEAELMSAKAAFEASLPAGSNIKVYLKGDMAAKNLLEGRVDPLTSEIANISMQHSGSSATAIVRANVDILGEIAGGYQHYVGSHMRQIAEISMHDIMDNLQRMSQFNTRVADTQALGTVAKMLAQPRDTANIMRNTMLGNSNLNDYSSWKTVNQTFETGISMASTAASKIWAEAISPLIPKFGKSKELTTEAMAKVDYEALAKKLESVGAVNPWANFDDAAAQMFGLAKLSDHKDTSKRIVYAGNALAATIALRFGEIAQPIVNAMSLPILTSLAISHNMPETFMGISKSTAKVSGGQVMHEGIRSMHDPRFEGLRDLWAKLGYFDPHISEANKTLQHSRQFDRGLMSKVEGALDSNLVRILSKPADWSEKMVRATTMHTGAVLAKRLYPELDDVGITIFARDFMDRAIGNYHSAQRPVFFQGTMGVALGLFQTYMLTLGQNVYRHLELKNYKALGKAALLQGGIFGAGSLPGFTEVSETIGEHFSDNNVDLSTGTYRAIGSKAGDILLYGLPSSLGPALHTRAEIAPRIPNPIGGLQNLVGVNFLSQSYDMLSHVGRAMSSENPDLARALGEAVSMQSMSRPLARMSEVATGHSVTRKGNTMATPEEVWTATGVISRIMSTRHLQEAKLRQADHLNNVYGAADSEARETAMIKVKTAIRNGTLNDKVIAEFAHEYVRNGGSPTGWRSAISTAIAQTESGGRESMIEKLKPDSPLIFMLENRD